VLKLISFTKQLENKDLAPLTKLEILSLDSTPIDAQIFSGISEFRRLRELSLVQATITNDVAPELMKLSELRSLNLVTAKMTYACKEKVARALPRTEVRF
jgi:hypothetical protein